MELKHLLNALKAEIKPEIANLTIKGIADNSVDRKSVV